MNLGGYDKHTFSESSGNRILGEILEKTRLVKVHFNELDKTPNFDGYFELCKNASRKKVPIGRFDVQIKTMSLKYSNDNSKGQISDYKYLCETKILNSVKQGITCNPAILFLVDIATKEVFFIHISPEFVISLSLTVISHN